MHNLNLIAKALNLKITRTSRDGDSGYLISSLKSGLGISFHSDLEAVAHELANRIRVKLS